MNACGRKSHAELVKAWDELASERHRQISLGLDVSFSKVVAPTAASLLAGTDGRVVMDVGSGTGAFTEQLAGVSDYVIGVEPSRRSTAIAREVCGARDNVEFVEAPLEEAVDDLRGRGVTAAVAVMSLMTTPSLSDFAQALGRVLRPGTRFAAVLTHPWFWPRYWGYEKASWYRYEREIFVEAKFVTSTCSTEVVTTHVHRPLELYARAFAEEGLVLERIVEPMPSAEVEALYPEGWAFPRFIGLRWLRGS